MSYEVKTYGNGSLGDVTEVAATINSYARVTAISATSITINSTTKIDGTATFEQGGKILIHVSAATATTNKTYLGCYLLATVINVSGSTLTIDQDFTKILPTSELSKYYVQAIAVAQYKTLTLNAGTNITPPVYSASSFVGGIVAIMCSEELKFNGGHISLADRGIPVASKSLRPTTANDVAADTSTYAGWENSDTHIHFMLNAGDGAAFIITKKLSGSADSRIGNVSTFGAQFYRGSATSATYGDSKPANVTNVGGSTILIAAESVSGFSTKMIAKYRSSTSTAGQGICRCYIASETKLRNDEGLYAYDCIATPTRLKNLLNVKDFGNGSLGDVQNPTVMLNNYATVTAVSGRKITYKNATTAGLAPIGAGSLVMIHFNHKNSSNVAESGRFVLANVLSNTGTVLTVDADLPNISATNYAAQIISIPQCNNFTLTTSNTSTPKFNGSQGGICAIAVKNNCNLSKGTLNVMQKGGGNAYARAGLATIGNAQNSDRLPIGAGHGSVFILAQNLTMDSSTRIGATYSGSATRAYKGADGSGTKKGHHGTGGSGSAAGTQKENHNGGYGANSSDGAAQGAHVMIVADKISGFCQAALSTGGQGSTTGNKNFSNGASGGAGYGGGGGNAHVGGSQGGFGGSGGYIGGGAGSKCNACGNWAGGGGASGWSFVYCNTVVNQDISGTLLAN